MMNDEALEVTAVEVVGDEPALPVEQPRVFSVSELRTQVEVANAYPRNIGVAVNDLGLLVASHPDVAASMYYGLKRGSKTITGPSIRFAEAVLYAWGNLRVYGRQVDITHSEVVCEGYAWDIQRNAAIARQVSRRIVDRDGNRYSPDMIIVTSNAATSIGIRNATLSVVPRAIWFPVWQEAMNMALGKLPLEKLVENAMAWWEREERTEEELLAYLGVDSVDKIDKGHLHLLRGLRTGVEEGSLVLDWEIARVTSKDSGLEAEALDAALAAAAEASESPQESLALDGGSREPPSKPEGGKGTSRKRAGAK